MIMTDVGAGSKRKPDCQATNPALYVESTHVWYATARTHTYAWMCARSQSGEKRSIYVAPVDEAINCGSC